MKNLRSGMGINELETGKLILSEDPKNKRRKEKRRKGDLE